jgi:hypothetical protein
MLLFDFDFWRVAAGVREGFRLCFSMTTQTVREEGRIEYQKISTDLKLFALHDNSRDRSATYQNTTIHQRQIIPCYKCLRGF